MIDFSYESLNKLFPILHGNSKYSAGMLLPAAQRFTYTEEQTDVLGGMKGVHAQNVRIDAGVGFEWFMNTFYRFKNETISQLGSYSTPKNFEDYLRLLPTLNINQIKNTIEDAELEIEATKQISKIYEESVFSDEVKESMEREGRACIKQKHFGHTRMEEICGEEYDKLAAVTKEKFKLLKVVAEFFGEVKDLYAKELALRQAQLPRTIKTLTENVKKIVQEGIETKKALEKAASEFKAAKTSKNHAEFSKLWDSFNALTAQFHAVHFQLFTTSPQAAKQLPDFPTLSHAAFYAHEDITGSNWQIHVEKNLKRR
jgi:hypothetical protein